MPPAAGETAIPIQLSQHSCDGVPLSVGKDESIADLPERTTTLRRASFRHRVDADELLDGPLSAGAELAGNLRDLDRVNRWLGGSRLVCEAVSALVGCVSGDTPSRGVGRRRAAGSALVTPIGDGNILGAASSAPTADAFGMAGRMPNDQLVAVDARMPITILDVGGGGGSGIRSTLRHLDSSGHSCRGLLLDKSGAVLDIARRGSFPSAILVRGDAMDLPIATRGIDITQCSLMLHHLAPTMAVRALREMGRVSRLGVVIDDLLRSSLGYAGALLLSRLATRNRLTRHDAPLSVRRAYTLAELQGMLVQAGLRPLWGAHIPGYRAVVAACPLP